MAAIAIQDVGLAGGSITFAAANTSDTVAVGSKRQGGYSNSEVILLYRNSDASTEDITVGSLAPVQIAASTGSLAIPVPDTGIGGGVVTVTMASATGITVAAIRVGNAY